MPPEALQRRRVIYNGRVQGVGFRYTTRRIAQAYTVTGFVRNLDDGSVELLVEGSPAEIDRLVAEIADVMGNNIGSTKTSNSAATGQFAEFEIAY